MMQTQTIYLTEVTNLGPEASDFLESGLMVLFAEGAPSELAEISILHSPSEKRESPPQPGDTLRIGKNELKITAVGEKAWSNILELGHAVFKFNGAAEVELPGEIYVEVPESLDLTQEIKPGVEIEIHTTKTEG